LGYFNAELRFGYGLKKSPATVPRPGNLAQARGELERPKRTPENFILIESRTNQYGPC
jgi:hypothetical protein